MVIENKKKNFGLILAVYLLGIFMGAIDTGIVTPARTVIQDSLGVEETAGIWMITIYTLAYAASIPVMGKLADRIGRRTVYLVAIILFGGGSFLCGLSHHFESFPMLLAARAIQAIGGGGIVPVANAEFGTTFPEEKRGMALGMVGGVYGIANILGASVGSAVMDIFGTDRWEFIFYVNVPIAIFVVIAGFIVLPNTVDKETKPIDSMGTCVLVIMVLSIMYGLKNIDFFEFVESVSQPEVYMCLGIFVILLPFFILIERRAADPVMNLKFFANIRIICTMCIATISGIILMGVVFIPQFCENALMVPSGSGGYFVIILGICAGVGAMSSGGMTDKMGPKIVLSIGLVASIIGALIVIFWASQEPNRINVFASLIFIGLGMGFTMGAPLNYMMLWEVEEREATSALATLSLVRSLGTVVAPAIMVGFIAHAGMGMSDNIMEIMPDEINVPELPYAEELISEMEDADVKGMPDLADMETIQIDMSAAADSDKESDFEIPQELLDNLQNSDVTTITASVKDMAAYMFEEKSPEIQKDINEGIDKGINGINDGINEMNNTISDMEEARSGMQKGIDGMGTAISKQKAALSKLKKGRAELAKAYDGVSGALAGLKAQYEAAEDEDVKAQLAGQISAMEAKQAEMKSSLSDMDKGIKQLNSAISKVSGKRNKLKSQKAKMGTAISGIKEGRAEAQTTLEKMEVLKAAIPGAFDQAEKDYLKAIDKKSDKIEETYQKTLNVGFRQIFMMTAIACTIGLLILAVYRRRRD